jgi:tetratricopeptide (TPR) repeat protein
VEELLYFVRTKVGWLNMEYRVGGNTDMIRRFIAAGIPVMIEETFIMAESYWPNDDRWAGHYLLVTGYDDSLGVFTTQDSFVGPNLRVSYHDLDHNWQSFNRVYLLVYRSEQEDTVKSILGPDWDRDANRQRAIDSDKKETEKDPLNAFSWFNLGTNLVYFDRANEAVAAYDQARKLGLPQRMLRYQFGPFLAYFHALRTDDLLTLTEYALKITPTSEEAMLWRGWGLYRLGKRDEAVALFQKALAAHPAYQDALYALNYVNQN